MWPIQGRLRIRESSSMISLKIVYEYGLLKDDYPRKVIKFESCKSCNYTSESMVRVQTRSGYGHCSVQYKWTCPIERATLNVFHLWPISPGNYYYKAHATIHCREIFKVDGLIQCDSIQVNYCPHAMPATCGASHVNYNTFWLLFHHHRYHAPHTPLQYDPSQRFVRTKPTPEEINTQQTCFHKRKGKKSDADGVQHRQKYESTLC